MNRWLLASALAACACGSNPAGPVPAITDYSGSWTGTTSQQTSFEFTVSTEQTITALSLTHASGGCSGAQSFIGLRVPITTSVSGERVFAHAAATPTGRSTEVTGRFVSADRGEGQVTLRNFPGCASTLEMTWQASKR